MPHEEVRVLLTEIMDLETRLAQKRKELLVAIEAEQAAEMQQHTFPGPGFAVRANESAPRFSFPMGRTFGVEVKLGHEAPSLKHAYTTTIKPIEASEWAIPLYRHEGCGAPVRGSTLTEQVLCVLEDTSASLSPHAVARKIPGGLQKLRTVTSLLSRLAGEGRIRRLGHGLYAAAGSPSPTSLRHDHAAE